MLRLLALAFILGSPTPAYASGDATACRSAIAVAERGTTLPDGLLSAIALIESGRRDPSSGQVAPWPWTINVEGVGHFYKTKADVIGAVLAFQGRGARSIDVGCMQINLLAHPNAFSSLDEAFDPGANARYGARFLTQLYQQTGTWPRATAGYHSLTPDIGDEYARKVMAALPAERGALLQSTLAGPRSVPPAANPLPFAAFGSAGTAGRIILLSAQGSGSGSGGVTAGRALDAYRAMPTRLSAQAGPFRRF